MISTFFRTDKLALCSMFISKDVTRFYLQGVHVETAGNEGALCKAAIDAVKKRKTREFCWFGIIGDDEDERHECRIFDTTDQASDLAEVRERMLDPKDRGIIWSGALDLIPPTFVEWRKAIPQTAPKNGTVAAFNGKLLADFVAVAKDRCKEAPGISICQDAAGAAIITAERPDFLGVIVPMRAEQLPLVHDMRHLKLPGWLAAPKCST